jgi:hypothetical protein
MAAVKTRTIVVLAALLAAVAVPAAADPEDARTKLMALPHAVVGRLVGSWRVKEMEPIKMIYEFQSATMAMHGLNEHGGTSFEMTLDADYRTAGDNALWVIGTHPQPVPEGMDANAPSIIGIEFTKSDEVTMTVSAGERFTLVKEP